ncbi:MAG: anion permease, partial [Propionibacterium sp.]|nr:anion permease [Propionibacterium sp.]
VHGFDGLDAGPGHSGVALLLFALPVRLGHRHISAMYVAFLGSAIAVGAPPMLAALLLGYISNAFTSLTQYAGGASPSLFGTGYNTASQWWRVSAVAGLVSIAIWLFVGSGWMKLVGLW